MKRITTRTMFFIALLLIFSSSGFCGDNLNIQVSCTIPAIPGVNAPLLISETKIAEVKKPAFGQDFQPVSVVRKVFYTFLHHKKPEYSLENDQQNTKQQPLPMIQEDTQKKDINEKEANLTMLVKTLYPR